MHLYIQMYPALPISHIEESKRPVTIHSWCKKGWGHCQTRPFIVIPYRCLGKQHTSLPQDNWVVHSYTFLLCPRCFFLIFEHFMNKENFCIFIGSTLTFFFFFLPMGVSTRACAPICISIFCWYWERTNTLDCVYTILVHHTPKKKMSILPQIRQ